MLQRMKDEHNGRPVRLYKVRRLPAGKSLGDRCWAMIQRTIGDGRWYSIIETADLEPGSIRALVKALKQRAFRAGYDTSLLKLFATIEDGVCFQWLFDPELAKREDIAAKRRIRKQAKNKHQHNWRAKKKRKEREKHMSLGGE